MQRLLRCYVSEKQDPNCYGLITRILSHLRILYMYVYVCVFQQNERRICSHKYDHSMIGI